MNMKQACEIVYAGMSIGQDRCRHDWYQGKCVHCNLTADWGHAVRELTAEVERLTMELDRLRAELAKRVTRTLPD
jgi:hypothetical protein